MARNIVSILASVVIAPALIWIGYLLGSAFGNDSAVERVRTCSMASIGESEPSVRSRFKSMEQTIIESTDRPKGSIADSYILISIAGKSPGELIVHEVGFAQGEVAFIGCFRNFAAP
jgi:hypothetical protein